LLLLVVWSAPGPGTVIAIAIVVLLLLLVLELLGRGAPVDEPAPS